MQPLGRWGIIDHTHFEGVRFICFKTCEFNHCRRCLENTVRTNCVESIMSGYWIHSDALSSINYLLLDLNNVLGLGN